MMGFQQTLSSVDTLAGMYATAGYQRIGFIWLGNERVKYLIAGGVGFYNGVYPDEVPTINIGSYFDSGGSLALWQMDPADGTLVGQGLTCTITGIHISADTMFTLDPNGSLWVFGLWVQSAMSGTHTVDIAVIRGITATPFPTGVDTNTDVVALYATYGVTGTVEDLGVDVNANRIWIRSASMNAGQVKCFNFTTGALIGSLYSPHKSKGIIPTGDGFVFIADAYQWVHLYDYDGAYWGSARNPFTAGVGGFVYGWDSAYKRLLCVQDIATGRVTGFRWAPNPVALTVPIPRSVPRKNRATYFFLNCCGDGGEGVSSRLVGLTDNAVSIGDKLSDTDGDIVERITPATTGGETLVATLVARTYVASPSSGYTLPQSVLHVGSTDGFATTGLVLIQIGAAIFDTVNYTGKTTSEFTGCTGGTNVLVMGMEVTG